MRKTNKHIIAFMLSCVLLMPAGVFAATTVSDGTGDSFVSTTRVLAASGESDTKGDVRSNLNEVAKSSGIGSDDPKKGLVSVIGLIVQAFLTLVGVIVTILIIYSGYLWMTASGNSAQVDKAKTMMTQAVIGLAITMAAYFISDFVVNAILSATLD